MRPHTFIIGLAALASAAVSAKDKDQDLRCAEDEYYNKMMESRNRKSAVTDCTKWLAETVTEPIDIPKYLKDCGGDKDEDRVSRVSAACSCISPSSVPATLSATTHSSSAQSSTAVATTSSTYVSPTGSTSRPQSTPSPGRPTSTTSRPSSSHPPPSSLAASESTKSSVPPSQVPNTSVTTSTIYTESIYTVTSCAPGKTKCPSASTTLVTSTIAVSTTICPVTETPRPGLPQGQPSTHRTTTTIYSTSTYTLTRCPSGAVNCPVGNLPITKIIPISTAVLSATDTLPPPEHGNESGNGGKQGSTPVQPGASTGNDTITHTASTTFTVVTIPTTIVTTMNGVTAQILTVVPVTSALAAVSNAHSAPTPSSVADDKHPAGSAQPSSLATSGSGTGNEPIVLGFISKHLMPANHSIVTGSSLPRPTVVTADGPGLAGSDGMRVAFLVFAVAALL